MGKKILEGVIIGVSAGIILSSFNFLYSTWIKTEQENYIHRTMYNTYIEMCKRRNDNRFELFHGVINSLLLILKNRSGNISYNKHYELLLGVTATKAHIDVHNYRPHFTMDMADKIFFDKIREEPGLSWLKLPNSCNFG